MRMALYNARGITAHDAYLDHLREVPEAPHDYRELRSLRRHMGALTSSEATIRTLISPDHRATVSTDLEPVPGALVRVQTVDGAPNLSGLTHAYRDLLLAFPEGDYACIDYGKRVYYSGPKCGSWHWAFHLVHLADAQIVDRRWNVLHLSRETPQRWPD